MVQSLSGKFVNHCRLRVTIDAMSSFRCCEPRSKRTEKSLDAPKIPR
jgi:hypothetical protein